MFYGRDAALVQGLDALRQMRLPVAENKKLFVVLGPSGVGKSSFLRTGPSHDESTSGGMSVTNPPKL